MFIAKFPVVAMFIKFEDFSSMVDKALEELEELINNNVQIENFVLNKEEEG
jgi:hypothetical protein